MNRPMKKSPECWHIYFDFAHDSLMKHCYINFGLDWHLIVLEITHHMVHILAHKALHSIRFSMNFFWICSCDRSLLVNGLFRLGQINNEYFYVLLCVNLKGGILLMLVHAN
jgi:hypothetical protein